VDGARRDLVSASMRTAVDTPLGHKVFVVGGWLALLPFMVARGGTLGALCPRIERRLAAAARGCDHKVSERLLRSCLLAESQ
jgi:hypothetical protein